jgi:UDP-glucose 4-epimerase
MKILVTGGAGYIGSVVAERLLEMGETVVIFDNLGHGHRAAVPSEAEFICGDLTDRELVGRVVGEVSPDAVAHLAAEALVGESVREPAKFFDVNVIGGLNLLNAMRDSGVQRLVFSSTAAVYGEPETLPIREDTRLCPVNAYGASKLAFEQLLPWYGSAYGLRHVSLRYFNACGATAERGEFHVPETHLIAILLEVALGLRSEIHLFGDDYDTPDGTCVRDYIHVSDIAEAHVQALAQIDQVASGAFNLGNGAGFSNREVVEATRRVTGCAIPVVSAPRRDGDPARLVASATRAADVLGWTPRYHTLEAMIETAWLWRQAHTHPYET